MVRLWDTHSGRERCALEWHFGDVRQLYFSADGRWLGSMSEDGVIKLWPWRELLQG
jgi:WD40 repeat protein